MSGKRITASITAVVLAGAAVALNSGTAMAAEITPQHAGYDVSTSAPYTGTVYLGDPIEANFSTTATLASKYTAEHVPATTPFGTLYGASSPDTQSLFFSNAGTAPGSVYEIDYNLGTVPLLDGWGFEISDINAETVTVEAYDSTDTIVATANAYNETPTAYNACTYDTAGWQPEQCDVNSAVVPDITDGTTSWTLADPNGTTSTDDGESVLFLPTGSVKRVHVTVTSDTPSEQIFFRFGSDRTPWAGTVTDVAATLNATCTALDMSTVNVNLRQEGNILKTNPVTSSGIQVQFAMPFITAINVMSIFVVNAIQAVDDDYDFVPPYAESDLTIDVTAPTGYTSVPGSYNVVYNDTPQSYDFSLYQQHSFTGTYTYNGVAQPGVAIRITNTDTLNPVDQTVTSDAEGKFTLTLLSGTYTLQATGQPTADFTVDCADLAGTYGVLSNSTGSGGTVDATPVGTGGTTVPTLPVTGAENTMLYLLGSLTLLFSGLFLVLLKRRMTISQ